MYGVKLGEKIITLCRRRPEFLSCYRWKERTDPKISFLVNRISDFTTLASRWGQPNRSRSRVGLYCVAWSERKVVTFGWTSDWKRLQRLRYRPVGVTNVNITVELKKNEYISSAHFLEVAWTPLTYEFTAIFIGKYAFQSSKCNRILPCQLVMTLRVPH